jgi:hypothetical protein
MLPYNRENNNSVPFTFIIIILFWRIFTMANTKASLDALYKDIYADKLDDLHPDFSKLLKSIPFREAKKTGNEFVQPVKLTNEQGFTYGRGVQTLSGSIDADNQQARIQGNPLTLQTVFSYDAAANMASSKGAFVSATKYRFQAMMESTTARLEAQLLYGGDNLGAVDSADDVADSIVISAASWAPGIWSGAENASVDIYSADKLTLRVTASIASVDHDTRTLVLDAGTDLSGVIATDVVMFAGSKGNEMIGLSQIVDNSDVLYGIDGSDYSLWKGNLQAVGGALTLQKILQGNAKAAAKGLMEDSVVYVSSVTFASLANDQASLRRYSGEVKKAVDGFTAIEFHAPSGSIEIIPHPMVKEGQALSFPKGKCERIGSTDITFNTPGGEGGEMFKHLANQTGYEVRLYTEQARVA